ncbi:type I polyketide synthase [Streptomyces sp. AGS-58]|uniref:type I polyketide synthase n=1 Tax=unclassified Streptomyces TaxID=2593676 RepID=UPI0035A39070
MTPPAAANGLDPDSPFLAVVGMAGRFPGAQDLGQFWTNLIKGQDSITRYPRNSAEYPDHVPAIGVLDGADEFDAEFFGYSPAEATLLDPQHRLFLECAWTALEDAGYDPSRYGGPVGVYAGSAQTGYYEALLAHRDRLGEASDWQLRLATGIDFLTSRVSFKLGLTGPAVTVQTACSTSLVAIHVAAQALLAGECDLALAGGAAVHVPLRIGEYAPGGVISLDGRVRTFDADADGTVGGNGVGVVVLKRLADALNEGDHIRAVLRGTAINNDGDDKVGYTAPGVTGQVEAIRAAQLVAEVEPETIGYVEAHGTGTPLGDPIEVAALTQAFREGTDARGFCRIGSLKTNIGHVDAAAGVAGFIKAALTVQHGLIPPSLNYTRPNPEIPFADSPFTVNTELYDWQPGEHPRRAGVSSFGLGGTNAHAVLEQPPLPIAATGPAGPQLLVFSTRGVPALAASRARLADHLQQHPESRLDEVAWTLQSGRKAFQHRGFVVAADHAEAIAALAEAEAHTASAERQVAFVFPGQGGQHVGMGRELYEQVPAFRARVDECRTLLMPWLGRDLLPVLHPGDDAEKSAAEEALGDMIVAQPAVFVVEYALARMWQDWGVRPTAVAGHSLGAFAAACIAGVMTLPEALRLVVERGRLLQKLAPGAMLAVPLPEAQLAGLLRDGIDLAAVNSPDQCVLSGPACAVEELRQRLTERGVDARRLHIAAAGHSAQVEPILDEFAARISELDLKPPTLPWVGDTTGSWVPRERPPSADFWVAHMRQPVRFGAVLDTLLTEPCRALLEIGPGRTLTSLARRHPGLSERQLAISSLPHPADDSSALHTALTAAGRLWQSGVGLDWRALHDGRVPRRTSLPGYPFQRQRHSPLPAGDAPAARPEPATTADVDAPEPIGPGGLEARVAEAFAQVLGLETVAPAGNFFELGGDSLIAVQLLAALRRTCGVAPTVKQVFGAPTPARLARLLADARR